MEPRDITQLNRLKYKALLYMEGHQVLVHDLEYDCYDQICEVKKETRTYRSEGKRSYTVTLLTLENEEFVYSYDWRGQPERGNFEVYSLRKYRSDFLLEELS